MKCNVDLNKTDCYGLIPDKHVEIALKVIRTMRNVCLSPDCFDADGAVILSHAHSEICKLIEKHNKE